MSRTLTYADAVRLLGGGKSRLVSLLDKAAGGVFTATGGVPGLLGWLGARAEFVRLGHDLVRAASEKRSGLSRYDRTQRLEAAHTVLMVVAYSRRWCGRLPRGRAGRVIVMGCIRLLRSRWSGRPRRRGTPRCRQSGA